MLIEAYATGTTTNKQGLINIMGLVDALCCVLTGPPTNRGRGQGDGWLGEWGRGIHLDSFATNKDVLHPRGQRQVSCSTACNVSAGLMVPSEQIRYLLQGTAASSQCTRCQLFPQLFVLHFRQGCLLRHAGHL